MRPAITRFAPSVRIPGKAASDSDRKHPLIPTGKHPEVGAQRRWGVDHFRSGWLRSTETGFEGIVGSSCCLFPHILSAAGEAETSAGEHPVKE